MLRLVIRMLEQYSHIHINMYIYMQMNKTNNKNKKRNHVEQSKQLKRIISQNNKKREEKKKKQITRSPIIFLFFQNITLAR